MIVYVDASVVLRLVVPAPGRLQEWGIWEQAYSSELLFIETSRALDRLRLLRAYDDEEELSSARVAVADLMSDLRIVELSRSILTVAARPMSTIVATLDALHLATALELRDELDQPLTFATHDLQQARGAIGLGFEVIGVSAS